jgi:hypothetical protein
MNGVSHLKRYQAMRMNGVSHLTIKLNLKKNLVPEWCNTTVGFSGAHGDKAGTVGMIETQNS